MLIAQRGTGTAGRLAAPFSPVLDRTAVVGRIWASWLIVHSQSSVGVCSRFCPCCHFFSASGRWRCGCGATGAWITSFWMPNLPAGGGFIVHAAASSFSVHIKSLVPPEDRTLGHRHQRITQACKKRCTASTSPHFALSHPPGYSGSGIWRVIRLPTGRFEASPSRIGSSPCSSPSCPHCAFALRTVRAGAAARGSAPSAATTCAPRPSAAPSAARSQRSEVRSERL